MDYLITAGAAEPFRVILAVPGAAFAVFFVRLILVAR